MKGKKVFFISALLGALGLVGGTFAAWAVTDNANPFQVNITPGTLDVGTDKAVTLDWGTKGLVNIENLKQGEVKGPYEVGLKATTSDNSGFTGSLSVNLSTTATAATKLIDFLTVTVYDNNTKTGTPLLTVPDELENYSIAVDIGVTSGVEKKVYFYIALDDGITPQVYNAIKSDIVTLTIDWNKGSKIDVITSGTYYFNNTAGWTTVKAFAWKESDGSSNVAWPGIDMKLEKGSIYSVAIPTGFDKIIFNNGNSGEGNQTADLDLPLVSANTPYYNGSAWAAKPDLSAETSYYLVGTLNEWTTGSAFKLTAATGKANNDAFSYTYKIENVNCAANTELKIVSSENVWYAEASIEGGAQNFKVQAAGSYDFFFNPAKGDGTHYIFCAAHQ